MTEEELLKANTPPVFTKIKASFEFYDQPDSDIEWQMVTVGARIVRTEDYTPSSEPKRMTDEELYEYALPRLIERASKKGKLKSITLMGKTVNF